MLRAARVCLVLVSSSLLLYACGDGGSSTGSSGSGGSGGNGQGGQSASGELPCAIEDALALNCRSCHANPPVYGAPMPLVTLDDLLAPAKSDPAKKVYELVGTRVHDSAKPMPPPPNPSLSVVDLQAIDDWVAAGAPAATADQSCPGGGTGGGSGTGGSAGLSCTPDLSLKPASAYALPQNVDDRYICYGVDITPQQKSQVIAFAPRVDNASIVHHLVLFQTDAAFSNQPTPCSGGGGAGWRAVSIWAPGGKPFELPPEAGFPLEGTTHYVVQVHYSNLNHLDGQTDTSGFDLCTTTNLRPNDADILAFGTLKFDIPAAGSLDLTCDFKVPAGIQDTHVLGGMPHMHQIGRLISTVNVPGGGGQPVDLSSRDPWDFNNQYWTPLDTVIKSGDTVRVRCAWDNPTSQNVSFGEATSEEMCFTFLAYYPKIVAPGFNWLIPAALSQCSPTP